MADVVTSQTIQDGQRKAVMKFTNVMSIKIDFAASTNVLAVSLPADSTGDEYYDDFSGIPNNAGSGKTGDLDFTTLGHSSGDTYVVILELIKNYG